MILVTLVRLVMIVGRTREPWLTRHRMAAGGTMTNQKPMMQLTPTIHTKNTPLARPSAVRGNAALAAAASAALCCASSVVGAVELLLLLLPEAASVADDAMVRAAVLPV